MQHAKSNTEATRLLVASVSYQKKEETNTFSLLFLAASVKFSYDAFQLSVVCKPASNDAYLRKTETRLVVRQGRRTTRQVAISDNNHNKWLGVKTTPSSWNTALSTVRLKLMTSAALCALKTGILKKTPRGVVENMEKASKTFQASLSGSYYATKQSNYSIFTTYQEP